MKPKLYLESTIPSYLAARPSRDVVAAGRQKITRDWWKQRLGDFDVFISETVIAEVSAGEPMMAKKRLELLRPFPILETNQKVMTLAGALIQGGPLPKKAARDAVHIATSAVHGIHFLMTWNCTHIANAKMFAKMSEICQVQGVVCPVICTPDELQVK